MADFAQIKSHTLERIWEKPSDMFHILHWLTLSLEVLQGLSSFYTPDILMHY